MGRPTIVGRENSASPASTDMVQVPRGDAEWLAHWRERCETGQLMLRWAWRAALTLTALAGSVGLAFNEWAPWFQRPGTH